MHTVARHGVQHDRLHRGGFVGGAGTGWARHRAGRRAEPLHLEVALHVSGTLREGAQQGALEEGGGGRARGGERGGGGAGFYVEAGELPLLDCAHNAADRPPADTSRCSGVASDARRMGHLQMELSESVDGDQLPWVFLRQSELSVARMQTFTLRESGLSADAMLYELPSASCISEAAAEMLAATSVVGGLRSERTDILEGKTRVYLRTTRGGAPHLMLPVYAGQRLADRAARACKQHRLALACGAVGAAGVRARAPSAGRTGAAERPSPTSTISADRA